MAKSFETWKNNGEHLPTFLRDSSSQGKIFRFLCSLQKGRESDFYSINDAQAAIFVIDIFLWVMANSGYTLQKTRTKFNDIDDFRNIVEDAYKWDGERHRSFMKAVMAEQKAKNSEKTPANSFGKHLENLRLEKKYQQYQLAYIANLDIDVIKKLEADQLLPSMVMKKALAKALDIDIKDLVFTPVSGDSAEK